MKIFLNENRKPNSAPPPPLANRYPPTHPEVPHADRYSVPGGFYSGVGGIGGYGMQDLLSALLGEEIQVKDASEEAPLLKLMDANTPWTRGACALISTSFSCITRGMCGL